MMLSHSEIKAISFDIPKISKVFLLTYLLVDNYHFIVARKFKETERSVRELTIPKEMGLQDTTERMLQDSDA